MLWLMTEFYDIIMHVAIYGSAGAVLGTSPGSLLEDHDWKSLGLHVYMNIPLHATSIKPNLGGGITRAIQARRSVSVTEHVVFGMLMPVAGWDNVVAQTSVDAPDFCLVCLPQSYPRTGLKTTRVPHNTYIVYN